MPGPGRKTKPKPKGISSPASASSASFANNAYLGQIDHAEGWALIADILCKEVFKLPDLTTRSGLKRIHADFDNIYRKLDTAYETNAGNSKIKGGIVGIYAKMCVDSLLRNKLFQKGFLARLLPLLKVPECRHLALQSLNSITHHGGVTVRIEVAKATSEILTDDLVRFPDDIVGAEQCISVLSHSLASLVNPDNSSPEVEKISQQIDLERIVRAVTNAAQHPRATDYIFDHASDLLAHLAFAYPQVLRAHPPSVRFLVAGLRSKDWSFRCTSISGLIRLHQLGSQEDTRGLDPQRFMASIQKGFPEHIQEILVDYGPKKTETYMTLQATNDFQGAMMKVLQDHDLYSLGLKLAAIIVRTEYSVSDGVFQAEDESGRRTTQSSGLPFETFAESLPVAAKAIRAKGKKGKEEDMADILDIKFSIMKGRIPTAVDLANRGLKRNPLCAYFYYALTLSADHVSGLRAAKKGMKCPDITPFLRFQMMQRAAIHAGDFGTQKMYMAQVGDGSWEEGIAFLTSAFEDAQKYIKLAPPDNRHMKSVLYWYIILYLVINGPEVSTDLHELNLTKKKLALADEISTIIGGPPPLTDLRLTQETILRLYSESAREWSGAIERRDLSTDNQQVSEDKAREDLAAWLEDLKLDGDGEEQTPRKCSHPKVNTNSVALYRCSHCGNPSAVLRKCSGCAVTRYCDKDCQKLHWKEHKLQCQAPKTETVQT